MSTDTPNTADTPDDRPMGKTALAEARRRYWEANQEETGDPNEYGTAAWCIEQVARRRKVGPVKGCPTFAPFIIEIAAQDVGVDVLIDWRPSTRTMTLRPGPAAPTKPRVEGKRPRELEAVEVQ